MKAPNFKAKGVRWLKPELSDFLARSALILGAKAFNILAHGFVKNRSIQAELSGAVRFTGYFVSAGSFFFFEGGGGAAAWARPATLARLSFTRTLSDISTVSMVSETAVMRP